jgi:uncharacterized hydrophobic protein (TIGR00271 family)
LLHYISIESEVEDFDRIHTSIEEGIIFKGTNLWILVFAIVVASVGLNMNSTAVIIGAMLISPLMGPINGMGYSIATYNYPLFRKALKNFGFAVAAGLIASTAYFAMSPVSTAHSELLARTSPTIYDVLIALFGGLAGIVAISSKLKGNVIPGVAIATALMPPLCTAGYGLATAQFTYFFGAFYLFTINTVFIAISSVVMSQVFRFPIRTLVDPGQKKRVDRWITLVIIVTIIPSIYFGYLLVQKEKFNENAKQFIKSVRIVQGNILMNSDIDVENRSVTLVFAGTTMDKTQKDNIRERASLFSLDTSLLRIEQGFTREEIAGNVSEVQLLKSEISRLNNLLAEEEKKQRSRQEDLEIGRQLLAELKTMYPQVVSCSYAQTIEFREVNGKGSDISQVVIGAGTLNGKDRQKIEEWLKTRLKNNALIIYFKK